MAMDETLAALGNGIGLLRAEEKKECDELLRLCVDLPDEKERAEFLVTSLEDIMKNHKYDHLHPISKSSGTMSNEHLTV